MRKEIVGIIFFFLVIFTLISLLSFSPHDPSINNARAGGEIHNLFGVLGAHVSGALIGLFGIGAFWIPLLLLLASIQFFGDQSKQVMISTLVGGIVLVITTGSLLASSRIITCCSGTNFLPADSSAFPSKHLSFNTPI